MFCPIFVWVTPLLLYPLFYYTSFSVQVFYQSTAGEGAQSTDDDTTYLIFIFTNLVFIGAINGAYGYYLISDITHTCGAFVNFINPMSLIYA
jgi:hypothetical protein